MARRFVACALLAMGVHACALGGAYAKRTKVIAPPPAVAALDALPKNDPPARKSKIAEERAAILARADREIASGESTLGESLIRLGWLDAAEESDDMTEEDREHALASYRAIVADAKARVAAGEPLARAIAHATTIRYKRMHRRLADALLAGGGNCVAQSTLAVALARDVGHADATLLVYANHVAPELGDFHFGMTSKCHGTPARVPAKDLLSLYARARETGDVEPFAFPRSKDACDDPGDVYGGQQLALVDPPEAARAKPPEDGDCRRRTAMDEYEEDVEAIGEDGRSLGGVLLSRSTSLDLAGHAESVSCFERRLEAPGVVDAPGPVEIVLALGDAAIAAEEAARVFSAAGELDVAQEYDSRLAGFRARAAAPLERVIAILAGDESEESKVIASHAGRLVSLGEGGRTAMLLASDRHAGYWEIANLLTKPSSQVGATERWAKKPLPIQLDVVDILPCSSQTFRSQIESVASPASSSLRAACEARVRGEQGGCALPEALARTEGDVAEAVLVRRMVARCHDQALLDGARAWSERKPPEIRAALAKRLGI